MVWAAMYILGIESKSTANTSCLKQLSKEKQILAQYKDKYQMNFW